MVDQGLKLAAAHSPFVSKFQCGPLKISFQTSTWRVKIRKNKSVNLHVIIPIHQDRNPIDFKPRFFVLILN
jgi:hypothetical protein